MAIPFLVKRDLTSLYCSPSYRSHRLRRYTDNFSSDDFFLDPSHRRYRYHDTAVSVGICICSHICWQFYTGTANVYL